jgi:hypothetical protein
VSASRKDLMSTVKHSESPAAARSIPATVANLNKKNVMEDMGL